ncbi:MAG: hypothetical protein AAGA08_05915 [Pseudomonadota bacterium]
MPKFVSQMCKTWKKVTAPLRREDGAVMMEAVIMMPLLAGFYCATIVWFDAYRQKTLIMKASYAVSDVLSREKTVDEPFLDNMRDILDFMIPSNARPKMRISLIHYNDDIVSGNKYRLMWSYGPYGMTDLTQADLDADSSWIPVMGDDDAVVVTETAVSYQPIFRVGIPDQIYRNTIVTRPRFAGTLTKTDEPPYLSNAYDIDNDGDGDPVGGEADPDQGGDPNEDPDHNGTT